MLAHFAEAVRPPVRQLRDDDAQELNAMTTRRNQVMTMLVAEKNRLSRSIPSVHPSIEDHIAWLEQQLKDLDDGLRQTLRQSPIWHEQDDLLRSVPGVGDQISLSLLSYVPELGTLKPEADCRPGGRGAHKSRQRKPCAGSAVSGVDGPECGLRSTWERWWPVAVTR